MCRFITLVNCKLFIDKEERGCNVEFFSEENIFTFNASDVVKDHKVKLLLILMWMKLLNQFCLNQNWKVCNSDVKDKGFSIGEMGC